MTTLTQMMRFSGGQAVCARVCVCFFVCARAVKWAPDQELSQHGTSYYIGSPICERTQRKGTRLCLHVKHVRNMHIKWIELGFKKKSTERGGVISVFTVY